MDSDCSEGEEMFMDLLLQNSKPIVTNVESTDSKSSSSDSDSDMDIRNRRMCINNYIEAVVPNYSEVEFKAHFRMKRATAHRITELFKNIVAKNPGGWPKVTAEKICYMTIWYLSNLETFRQIGDRFDVSRGCAFKVIRKAVAYLRTVASVYIKWPNETSMQTISQQFKRKQGIEKIIGAIDGSHISIKKPHTNGDDYINRKGYPSILLQGVVDANLKFINVCVGEPGSLHDARMLRRSLLYRKAVNDEEHVFKGYFLLGDSAYPSLNWLVPPYKDNGHLTNEQKEFNYRHSSTRIVVENTFGLLKGRFRRLNHFDNTNLKLIIDCIITACVLHNICQSENDNGDDFVQADDNDEDVDDMDTSINTLSRRDAVFLQIFD